MVDGASKFARRTIYRLLNRRAAVAHRDRLFVRQARLDQAAFVLTAETWPVLVTQVNLNASDRLFEALQSHADRLFDLICSARAGSNVLVVIDLNSHATLLG